MTEQIVFTVLGTPRPQGSKRHVGRGRMIESSKHVAGWRERITLFAQQTQKRMNGAVNVYLDFSFARPKGHFGTGRNVGQLKKSAPEHKESKPDVDKLSRAVLDAITNVVIDDDSCVVGLAARKHFGSTDCLEVRIEKAS